METQLGVQPCPGSPMDDVGLALRRVDAMARERSVPDDELEIHIEDCEHLYLMAYERFRQYGCPHDRDDALLHLHRMNVAILCRSPAAQAARHAAFEQRLADGIDFFQSRMALDMGRTR